MSDLGNLIVTIGTKLETGGFDKLLGQLKVITIAGAAVTAGFKVLTTSIEAASESEQVVNKLTLAMKNQGIYTEQALKTNLDFANSLMKVTATSDEEITKAMEVLTTYGLHDEQLRKTTQVTLDFAKAKGIDLVTASNLVGKAFAGETGTLTRYGIVIGENVPKTQKFEAVMGQLNQRFGGTAQNDAKTYAGQIQTFKNNLDELYESIGKRIIPALTNFVQGVNDLIGIYDKLDKGIEKTNSKYVEQSKYKKQLIALEEQMTKAIDKGDKAKQEQIQNTIKYLVKEEKALGQNVGSQLANTLILSESERLAAEQSKALKDTQSAEDIARAATEDALLQGIADNKELKEKELNDRRTMRISQFALAATDALADIAYAENLTWSSIADAYGKAIKRMIVYIMQQLEAEKIKSLAVAAMNSTITWGMAAYQIGLVIASYTVAAAGLQRLMQFDQGGIVPGPRGAAQLILAHGGETILPTHKDSNAGGIGGMVINVHLPAITSKQEARRHADIIGEEIYRRVKNNRKV